MTTPPGQPVEPYPHAGSPTTSTTPTTAASGPAGVQDPRRRHPGAGTSLAANLVGAFVGLIGALVGVSLVIAGSSLIHRRLMTFGTGVDGGGITLLLIGVLVLGVVIALGAWSPAAPIFGGVLVSFVGIVGLLSNDFIDSVSDLLPSRSDASYLYSWIGLGAMLTLGLLLIAAGVGCALSRRRALPPSA
ncbi:MAG TPA: hypothetical protein VIP77_14045 [Jiangellaceae bacterium]